MVKTATYLWAWSKLLPLGLVRTATYPWAWSNLLSSLWAWLKQLPVSGLGQMCYLPPGLGQNRCLCTGSDFLFTFLLGLTKTSTSCPTQNGYQPVGLAKTAVSGCGQKYICSTCKIFGRVMDFVDFIHFVERIGPINPFTATACKISGLKSIRTSLQNSTLPGPITNLFSILCILTEILLCQCEKANKKTQNFQISPFYCPFSSDIMAVKGLTSWT